MFRAVRLVRPSIPRTISTRATLTIAHAIWAFLLIRSSAIMRASVDATAVFVMRATAPSTHATHSKFATTGTALSLSLTLAACSPGEQAASWNAATITFASKQTDEEPVLFSERHTCWPSLLMATIQATTLYEVDSYQVDSSIESTMKCHCAGLRQTQQTYGVAIIPRYTEKKERQKKHEMK